VEDISDKNIIQKYCDHMKVLQFDMGDFDSSHSFKEYMYVKLEPQALKRIISEITSFKNGLPLNYESTIWLRVPKTNMNLFTFIISGPKDTPYENGLFKFDAYLPYNYPSVEPKVLLKTTGNGTVRFNPNLYNCGKVCLSLLGTWSGDQNEKWNPKTSTFLQVLVSIQSLILVEEPFFNEPGYEKNMHTPTGRAQCKAYNENIQIATIKWGMIDQIKNPNIQYKNVILEHFKFKKDDIIKTVNKWLSNCDNKLKSTLEIEVKNLTELLNTLIC
jgi:baculoviral IAP repeat-containing protein 6